MIGDNRRIAGRVWRLAGYATVLGALAGALLFGCSRERDKRGGAAAEVRPPESSEQRDAGPAADAIWPAFRTFPDLASAARQILAESQPRILGVGEFHVRAGAQSVLSTMERFTADIDALTDGASDLIVETWVQDGKCGAKEAVVSRDVEHQLERPPAVQDHLLTMLNSARQRGLTPHVMTMTCADYEGLVSAKVDDDDDGDGDGDGSGSGQGQVDFEKMLLLTRDKLAGLARDVVRYRASADRGKEPGSAGAPGMIVIYGGALHNDEYPFSGLADISYVKDVRALVGDGYVELDLYVPEYIEGNTLAQQETWYPPFVRHASAERVLVFQRGPRSYLVILRRARSQP